MQKFSKSIEAERNNIFIFGLSRQKFYFSEFLFFCEIDQNYFNHTTDAMSQIGIA